MSAVPCRERQVLAAAIEDLAVTSSIVRRDGDQWTWQYGDLEAPRSFETYHEAEGAFEQHLMLLVECDRLERAQAYRVQASLGAP